MSIYQWPFQEPQNMALYGTVPPFEDPEIPTDYTGNHQKNDIFRTSPGIFWCSLALSTKPPAQLQGEPLSASNNESIRESIRELMGIYGNIYGKSMGISMGTYGNIYGYSSIFHNIP
jgi:hypothetical protein